MRRPGPAGQNAVFILLKFSDHMTHPLANQLSWSPVCYSGDSWDTTCRELCLGVKGHLKCLTVDVRNREEGRSAAEKAEC